MCCGRDDILHAEKKLDLCCILIPIIFTHYDFCQWQKRCREEQEITPCHLHTGDPVKRLTFCEHRQLRYFLTKDPGRVPTELMICAFSVILTTTGAKILKEPHRFPKKMRLVFQWIVAHYIRWRRYGTFNIMQKIDKPHSVKRFIQILWWRFSRNHPVLCKAGRLKAHKNRNQWNFYKSQRTIKPPGIIVTNGA